MSFHPLREYVISITSNVRIVRYFTIPTAGDSPFAGLSRGFWKIQPTPPAARSHSVAESYKLLEGPGNGGPDKGTAVQKQRWHVPGATNSQASGPRASPPQILVAGGVHSGNRHHARSGKDPSGSTRKKCRRGEVSRVPR